MDKLYNEKTLFKMDDLGGKTHYFWKHPISSMTHTVHGKRLALNGTESGPSTG